MGLIKKDSAARVGRYALKQLTTGKSAKLAKMRTNGAIVGQKMAQNREPFRPDMFATKHPEFVKAARSAYHAHLRP